MLTVSVVSHRQGELVRYLLEDIHSFCGTTPLRVLLTMNVEESLPFDGSEFSFELRIIKNSEQRGFAANHNAAFREACGEYFCVINPDIRFGADPFPALVRMLANPGVGLVGPLVLGAGGDPEDSARRFPTPFRLLQKLFGGGRGPDYAVDGGPIEPDWIAGMFMLWRSDAFRAIGGFDEKFFLYYEDVDACARLRGAGLRVMLEPAARVTHFARRASHRNLRYLRWHLASMLRYFFKRIVG